MCLALVCLPAEMPDSPRVVVADDTGAVPWDEDTLDEPVTTTIVSVSCELLVLCGWVC